MDYITNIAGHELEYIDAGHLYLIDGILVPSITQILAHEFGSKYDHVDRITLQNASEKGTAVHEAIERFCETGEDDPVLRELRNFKWLQREYKFEVLRNEVPVILFGEDGEPIAAGRLDMVIRDENGAIGLADVKRTSKLDKAYLFYQLNLYRIAYEQDYGEKITFLRGIHLREDTRKYVKIGLGDDFPRELIKEYYQEVKK
mgnify:CR=1 FL=1